MGIYPFQNKSSLVKNEKGFTLIEVIATLILISIVTVAIVSRRTGSGTDLIAAAEVLKGHLRYAQSRAMSLDSSWEISFGANSYTLGQNGVPSGILPGESGNTVTLSGIAIAATTVTYSSNWGIPDASHSIILSEGPNSETITITSETGFIP